MSLQETKKILENGDAYSFDKNQVLPFFPFHVAFCADKNTSEEEVVQFIMLIKAVAGFFFQFFCMLTEIFAADTQCNTQMFIASS